MTGHRIAMPASPTPAFAGDPVPAAASRRGWWRAAIVVALCTAISELVALRFDLANIIMVYLAGVAYVALHESQRVAIATVVASIFLFDLIFVPPRWGLNPLNPTHLFTFAVMLAVGVLISRLAARARGQTALAEGRARRAQALSELAASLAAARSHPEIEAAVAQKTRATFGTGCSLRADGQLALDTQPTSFSCEDRELVEGFGRQAALALERSRFEQQSAEALVAAETERLRNTLLSGISHDFRTPLTTIVGAATTLLGQDQRLDPPKRTMLTSSILAEARRLHELVSDLLDLSRMEEGAVQLTPEWCPADDLVQEALSALGERTAGHQVEVQVSGEAVVWCDPRLVEQALVNMVDNAVRYTPAGSRVRIAVAVDSGWWLLTVSDNGPGLPKGSEQQVFRKFQRGQAEPAGGGFGLGLAICAAVAKLHAGSIAAHNAGGAVFELRLPQPAAMQLDAEAPA